MVDLAARLPYFMSRAGISRARLAELCGVSVSAVARWLSAKDSTNTGPSQDRWPQIAEALGVDVQTLLFGEIPSDWAAQTGDAA